jgi:alpha-L-fucosidase
MKNRYHVKKIVYSIVCFLAVVPAFTQPKNAVAILPTDSEKEIVRKAANVVPSKAQLRWQQLELTAFFHFGINTFTDKEWGLGNEDPALFNPQHLDATQWVKVCKEAGIKQVVLTAKHHDGFCLWPSAYTEYSVKNSPWKSGKGDVVKELSEACKAAGMGFGVYLSPWDRNAPSYGTATYNDYFINQLTELLTNYGKIDEVWFDGANGEGPNGKKQVYDFQRWYKLIRKLQPNAIIAIMGPDVRWVGNEAGKGREQEWSVIPVTEMNTDSIAFHSQQKDAVFKPKTGMKGDDLGSREKIKSAAKLVWYPAETDVSIRPGWFYHDNQNAKVKSVQTLMNIYLTSVGMNSVLLLNIPPDKNGLINEADIKSLRGWKMLRDSVFKKNYLEDASIKLNGTKEIKCFTDKNILTSASLSSVNNECVIEADMKSPQVFNLLQLQENISKGQRIESFILEVWKDGRWEKHAEGTTVGYKRIIPFKKVTAQKIRLRILASRLNPHLAEMGLFLMDTKY